MTQGSSYPLAGIKIGQTPAHRLSSPTPTLASSVSTADTEPSTSPGKSKTENAPASPTDTTAAASVAAEKDVSKQEPDSTTSKQPTKDSNEVEVTTSDQISEHGLPTNGRSTHTSSTAGTSVTGRSGAPDRRTAMGVASVRIAGRLTQNELGSRTGDIRTPDTSVGPDELLQLLGEYLVSGGLQNPEIHVRSNGQTIVLDLLNPAKGYR